MSTKGIQSSLDLLVINMEESPFGEEFCFVNVYFSWFMSMTYIRLLHSSSLPYLKSED